MIFAKVDVGLRDNERAHRAGPAMGTWLWALLYARCHETDGHIPAIALRLAWAGEKQAKKDAATLVLVGLFEKTETGFRLCKYGEKNETKEAIEKRRAEVRERVQSFRQKRVTEVARNGVRNALHPGGGNAFVPDSDSDSDSDSGSDLGEGVQGERPTTGVRVAEMPDWFREAAKTVEMNTGLATTELPALWLEYLGARHRKGWRPDKLDAASWLSAVLRSDRAKAKARAPAGKPPGAAEHERNKPLEVARDSAQYAKLRDLIAGPAKKGTGT